MEYSTILPFTQRKIKTLICSALIGSTMALASSASASPTRAYFADELNTPIGSEIGNRILEIDVENMELVNVLKVPGMLGHHADNAFNSKIYGVPKGSGYINSIELRKDTNGATTSMGKPKRIKLIHEPRSGDAYNKKFNVILMVAANRPMGTFINVESDEIVGTIGENVDCKLNDGTLLSSKPDRNTVEAATKYHCKSIDHGGHQISGHPYWLTPDYAAIVDRSNRQISTYFVWREGTQLKSRLVNHLPTRTSVHQIVPRDRTKLPGTQKADFYATEEGNIGDATTYGIPEALIKMKLTTKGLQLVKRMDLQRPQATTREKSDRILSGCVAIYLADRTFMYPESVQPNKNILTFEKRRQQYAELFAKEGITPVQTSQDKYNDFPVECLHAQIPGGHNADFAPDNKHLYVGMAGGMMSVIDVDRMHIVNNVDTGLKSGPGHVCFSEKHKIALVTNHKETFHRIIAYHDRPSINMKDRPSDGGRVYMTSVASKEGLIDTYQSHTCYVDEKQDFYYNFFTDGGVFYKVNLKNVSESSYNTRKNRDFIEDSLYTGGIPIQGSYIKLDDIKVTGARNVFRANNDKLAVTGTSASIQPELNDLGYGLIVTATDKAFSGTVKIVKESGLVTYTPNKGFSGKDGFWYQVTDDRGYYTWAYVDITVTSPLPAPAKLAAYGDTVSSSGNNLTINVLANDKGTDLKITAVDKASLGTASIVNNKIVYRPTAGLTGADEFWYQITDIKGWYTWARVVVKLTQKEVEFIAVKDAAATTKGKAVSIDVLKNDKGVGIKLIEVQKPGNGTAKVVANKVVYTPATGFTGVDEVWYQITDSRNFYTWAQILITVK